ncbi:hypothetical protein evm_013988 [Chilo suppressalis]|nr:hypothetical protein evm_013988 [Chilo suppressalis]
MLGAAAHISGHLFYAHATYDKLMYVGATAAALGPCVAPLIRSMTSKVLPASEREKRALALENTSETPTMSTSIGTKPKRVMSGAAISPISNSSVICSTA